MTTKSEKYDSYQLSLELLEQHLGSISDEEFRAKFKEIETGVRPLASEVIEDTDKNRN